MLATVSRNELHDISKLGMMGGGGRKEGRTRFRETRPKINSPTIIQWIWRLGSKTTSPNPRAALGCPAFLVLTPKIHAPPVYKRNQKRKKKRLLVQGLRIIPLCLFDDL